VLGEALHLVRAQLLVQIADDGSLDVRATGIVGFNGALVAATIAAKNLLGTYWYAPFFPLGISTIILLSSLFGGLDRRISKLEKEQRRASFDVGIEAVPYYEAFGGSRANEGRVRLLGDLAQAFKANAGRLNAKRQRLQWAIGVLIVGLLFASVLIGRNLPTTIPACPTNRSKAPCDQRASRTSGPAAKKSSQIDELRARAGRGGRSSVEVQVQMSRQGGNENELGGGGLRLEQVAAAFEPKLTGKES
jgi:hypothetical protein